MEATGIAGGDSLIRLGIFSSFAEAVQDTNTEPSDLPVPECESEYGRHSVTMRLRVGIADRKGNVAVAIRYSTINLR